MHGCFEELRRLVDDVVQLRAEERLVLVGDLVARGPDSGAVVAFARERNALSVRGNHEAHLLAFRRGEKKELGAAHRIAAEQMSAADWRYLEETPITLDFPEHGLRVVHAGMDPALPWEAQQEDVLVTIRHVKGRAEGESVQWGSLYQGPPHVVFGHDARAGLQLHAWCTGLDTGCVYGGLLTGLLLEEGQLIPNDTEARAAQLVSTPAAKRYFAIK